MNEFLTDNVRLAYPLEREMPQGTKPLWAQLMSDACVATDLELADGARLSLVSVQRASDSRLSLVIGAAGIPSLAVDIPGGLGRHAVVYASSDHVKAMLTVNGGIADEILATGEYGDAVTAIDVPFALRCTSSAHRRVESLEAYSPALCDSPVFSHAERPMKTITGGDVMLVAKDGLDLEAVELTPLEGRLLRLSAISAPAGASGTDTDVDLMIRGDGCFTVEALPGTKVVGDTIQPRTGSEEDGLGVMGGGVIRIGNACKPCCQCEDYKAAVDAIRDPATLASSIKQILDVAKSKYDEAVAEFDARKADAVDAVNSASNVRCSAIATASPSAYADSTVPGKRARVSVTLSIANMTQRDVSLSRISINPNDADFTFMNAVWTRVSDGITASGTTMPASAVLRPGGTLLVAATYAKTDTQNRATKPSGMTASMTIAVAGYTAETRTIDVT